MTHIPTEKEIGLRIDAFVAEREEITRSAIQKLIEKGNVRVNDKPVKKSYKVEALDVIEIDIPEPEEISVSAEDIPLDVFYEDDDLIVVNKPKGMVVHPAPGNYSGTLVNALLFHCKDSLSGINGEIRPGIVHRIDKDTSGLLVVAKNDKAHNSLAAQIKEHSCERTYEAVVVGSMKDDEGTVNAPIARHPYDRKKMAIVTGGREAITHWSVVTRYEGYTHLRLRLETGRTHQIRVHMASVGHSVFCDSVYGGLHTKTEAVNASKINGQCLHARTLSFNHPTSGERMRFESELPKYFTDLLGKLTVK